MVFQRLSDRIQLPGILQAQGHGIEISTNTPWVLSLYDHAWFLRDDYLTVHSSRKRSRAFPVSATQALCWPRLVSARLGNSPAWAGRRVVLHLERPRWQTTVWLDSRQVGSNNSLVAPHVYDLVVSRPAGIS